MKCLVFHIDFLLTTYFTKDSRGCAGKTIYYTESASLVYHFRTSSLLQSVFSGLDTLGLAGEWFTATVNSNMDVQ